MTVRDLLGVAGEYEDFEIQFSFTDGCGKYPDVRTFSNLEIVDIGYSDKVICLTDSESD